MSFVIKGLAAAGIAVAVMLAPGTAANAMEATPAATGKLTLESSPQGNRVVYIDPAVGCHTTISAFTQVTNRTDAYVTVYTGLQCTGFSQVIDPGSPTTGVGPRRSFSIPS